jgi:hypothetical protein
LGKVEGRGWYLIRYDIAGPRGNGIDDLSYIRAYYPDAANAKVYISGELIGR